jgi:hypothetical protein
MGYPSLLCKLTSGELRFKRFVLEAMRLYFIVAEIIFLVELGGNEVLGRQKNHADLHSPPLPYPTPQESEAELRLTLGSTSPNRGFAAPCSIVANFTVLIYSV